MNIKISSTKSKREIEFINNEIYKAYNANGLARADSETEFEFYPELDMVDNTVIYVAKNDGGDILGSVSYTIDQGKSALPSVYDEYLSSLRQENKTIISVWRFYVNSKYTNTRIAKVLLRNVISEIASIQVDNPICLFSVYQYLEAKYLKILSGKLLMRKKLIGNSIFNDGMLSLIEISRENVDKWVD